MIEALRRDYQAMAGMIFGAVPSFADVLDTVSQIEAQINQA
jgi:hypothetical protein